MSHLCFEKINCCYQKTTNRLRESESDFCFKKYRLFCDDEADEEAEKKGATSSKKMCKVATLSFE